MFFVSVRYCTVSIAVFFVRWFNTLLLSFAILLGRFINFLLPFSTSVKLECKSVVLAYKPRTFPQFLIVKMSG